MYFIGSDLASKAISASLKNFSQLCDPSQQSAVKFLTGDFEKLAPQAWKAFPSAPIIISNIPYGLRLTKDLHSTYHRLNKLLKDNKSKFKDAYVIDGSNGLFLSISNTQQTKWEPILNFSNG
jgi:23S rRNA G2445 N2-methylase RlmL